MRYFRVTSLLALLALMSFTFTSCDNDSRAENKMEQAADNVSDAWEAESREINDELKEMRANIDARLDEIDRDLENASDEARVELEKSKAKLKQWGDDIDNRMHRIGNDIEDGWADFKSSTEKRMEQIERDLEKDF